MLGSAWARALAGRFLLGASLGAALAVPAAAGADGVSIAVIDLQGAMRQTEEGMRAVAILKKFVDRRQQELDGKQDQMAHMKDDIERQSRILSRAALSRRMESWQREMVGLQKVFVDYDKELQKKQNDLMAPILQRMVAIVTRLAQKNGYDLVIDKQVAPFARPDLDITDRVIQMYNSGEGE